MDNYPLYMSIFLMLIVIYFARKKRNGYAVIKMQRKKGDRSKMKELAQNFVGKECIVYTFSDGQTVKGVIKEVKDNALLIENGSSLEAVNLDFVVRIREYPRNKNGKKKSIVID